MAQVVHTIKGKQYLYEHTRVGEKVVCKYIGPVGSGGKVRAPKHGGGSPLEVTQQTPNQIKESKTINKSKDNSSIGQEAQEKSTMEKIDLGENTEITFSKAIVGSKETTMFEVKKNGEIIKNPFFDPDDKLTDDQLDKMESKRREFPKSTEFEEMGTVKMECRDMYYAEGDTFPAKDELKASGMNWNPNLKKWESSTPITREFEGVSIVKIPTYKTENAWTWYK